MFIPFLIILIEGFVTLSAEIITLRQLLPIVGGGVEVTSLIIGFFLLFLAYGYKKGGTYQSDIKDILQKNFLKAALWMGIGLSTPFIKLFFYFWTVKFTFSDLVGLVFYLLFITSPLVYYLAQTVPLTTHFFKKDLPLSIVSSRILHWNTLGSFLGAILTSLILMTFLGVGETIFVNFILLLFLSFLLIEKSSLYEKAVMGLLLFPLSWVIYSLTIDFNHTTFVASNIYADYSVIPAYQFGKEKGKLLFINESPASFLSDSQKSFPYIERIKKILFKDLALKNKEILVLGAGGFTLSARGEGGNHFTYVDIDPQLKKIVEKHFLSSIQGHFIPMDARRFLSLSHAHYDVVISDTYSNRNAIPYHLTVYEYFKQAKTLLKPDGLAIFNIVASPTLEDSYSKRMDNTIRAVFHNCMVLPFHYSSALANILYLCKKSPWEEERGIYTDNRNQGVLDSMHH